MLKLKILPPTLRDKKRYIAIDLYSQNKLKNNEIIHILGKSVINIYGEITSSKINLWVENIKNIENDKRYQYRCILQCIRGYEEDVILALNTITRYNDSPLVVHTLKTSGTIRALNKTIETI